MGQTSLVKERGAHSRGKILYLAIRDQIARGVLKPGDRLLSSRELQRQFNLSYHATLEALERLEEEGFVERRPGAGTFVGSAEVLNSIRQRSKRIKLIISGESVGQGFLSPLVSSLKLRLDEMGCDYTAVQHDDDPRPPFEEGEADGAIWVCAHMPWRFDPPPMPMVLVSHDLAVAWHISEGYDIVTVDNRQGGAVAGRYLREIGCKRPAVLGALYRPTGEKPCPLTEVRLRGFEEGWGETVPASRVLLAAGHAFQEAARMAMDLLAMEPRPDAVFATSDDLAGGLCHALVAHHIEVGKEIKVVGFDGQSPAYRGEPMLTSVRAPLEEMGRVAAELGVERSADPKATSRRVHLACTLRMGETA